MGLTREEATASSRFTPRNQPSRFPCCNVCTRRDNEKEKKREERDEERSVKKGEKDNEQREVEWNKKTKSRIRKGRAPGSTLHTCPIDNGLRDGDIVLKSLRILASIFAFNTDFSFSLFVIESSH